MISVILPTYNEAENIVPLIEAISDALTPWRHEIIVVDDNSPDGTSTVVQNLIDADDVPGVLLRTRPTDRGLRKSIAEGLGLAQGDTVVWMDCDFSMPPEVIPELLRKIEEGYDIAVGSRFVRGGKAKVRHHRESSAAIALSTALNVVLGMLLTPRFRDWTSGFAASRRDVFSKIRLRGDYGEYFMDLIFRSLLLGLRVVEIPYECAPRRAGESKTAPNIRTLFKRGVKYLGMLLRLQVVRVRHWCGLLHC